MVRRGLDLAETAVRFAPKSCSASDAIVVMICFLAIGLLFGFFIGTYLTS
jgi:hypothetical protein